MTDGELDIPKIEPVAENTARPRWSVMIPTYNAAATVGKTLRSILDHGPWESDPQIAIVDNVSNDNTLAVIEREVQSAAVRPEVHLHRNDCNLGMAGNWTQCVRLARGEFVHILHADDYVLPGFYGAVEAAFRQRPQADLCLVRAQIVDANGELERIALRQGNTGDELDVAVLAYGNQFFAPGVVVRRSCYERVGGFTSSFNYVPDWEMWSRVLSVGKGVYVNDPLVCYREAAGNLTNRYSKTADDLREMIRFGEILKRRVPGFVPLRWRDVLKQHAVWAMANWERAGDEAAYAANRRYWRKFATVGEKLDVALAKAKAFGKECERPLRAVGRQLRPKKK